MPRLIVHGFTISLVAGLVSFSIPLGDLEGIWSGQMLCKCQGETMINDGQSGDLHFEFWPNGVFRNWMDPKVEGAWGMSGVYRIEGDSLIWKHDAASAWGGARILMMNADSMVIEEAPEKGCICTSSLHRTDKH